MMKLKHPIILAAAVLLASVSGYFSVNGMASVYAGSSTAVIAIFVAIECGKLANAAFLHANWRRMGLGLRAGLSILLLATMALTSAGVYGQLTHAFLEQEPARVSAQAQVKLLKANLADLDRQIEALDRPVDTLGLAKTVALRGSVRLAANLVGAERKDAATRTRARAELTTARATAASELASAEVKLASHEIELGPAMALASLAGLQATTAIKLMTLIATLCLDPLAVMLVMAAGGRSEEKPARGIPQPKLITRPNRAMTTKQKREAVAKLLKADPKRSNRQIAKIASVDHKTVGTVRTEMERHGEIPRGANGEIPRARKSAPKPGNLLTLAR